MPSIRQVEQPYLGPARVCQVKAHQVQLRLPEDRLVWARLALAFSYEPQLDDEVLVIGKDEGHYVIGVLQGSGTARMTFPHNVELRSAKGTVRVVGGKGVEIEGPELAMRADRVRMFARSMVQQLGSVYQTVTEVLHLCASATYTLVEGTSHTQAKRAKLLTEEEVSVNGKSINLG